MGFNIIGDYCFLWLIITRNLGYIQSVINTKYAIIQMDQHSQHSVLRGV